MIHLVGCLVWAVLCWGFGSLDVTLDLSSGQCTGFEALLWLGPRVGLGGRRHRVLGRQEEQDLERCLGAV